jgi:hypothetical protein
VRFLYAFSVIGLHVSPGPFCTARRRIANYTGGKASAVSAEHRLASSKLIAEALLMVVPRAIQNTTTKMVGEFRLAAMMMLQKFFGIFYINFTPGPIVPYKTARKLARAAERICSLPRSKVPTDDSLQK